MWTIHWTIRCPLMSRVLKVFSSKDVLTKMLRAICLFEIIHQLHAHMGQDFSLDQNKMKRLAQSKYVLEFRACNARAAYDKCFIE